MSPSEDEVAEQIHKSKDPHGPSDFMFSAHSESSVASQMEDTPSNYNQINGRIEGESKGLKVFHTHTNAIRGAGAFMAAGKKNKNKTAELLGAAMQTP